MFGSNKGKKSKNVLDVGAKLQAEAMVLKSKFESHKENLIREKELKENSVQMLRSSIEAKLTEIAEVDNAIATTDTQIVKLNDL